MRTTSPYKTAEELGIEQWMRDGLVALVGPLSRYELNFSMAATHPRCGSAGCIGGWLDYFAGKMGSTDQALSYANRLPNGAPLRELFYPNGSKSKAILSDDGRKGARAIINFLTLGDSKWDDVMREPDIADFDADDSGAVLHVLTEDA